MVGEEDNDGKAAKKENVKGRNEAAQEAMKMLRRQRR